jgi:hypothetical protein
VRVLEHWNERFGAWMLRHPWGYSMVHASVLVGVLALLQRDNLSDLWPLLAGGWVVIVLVTGLTRKLLPPKKATPVASSLPSGAGAMDEGGRRHRQGLP